MKGRNAIVGIIVVGIVTLILLKLYVFKKQEVVQAKDPLPTESFIQQHLIADDGRIRTNITDQSEIYLSETVGLWMDYLLAKEDSEQFNKQAKVLKKYFLTSDYLVAWELKGTMKAPANASIDDFRIMNAFYEAGEKWNNRSYTKMARKMAESLSKYHLRQGFLVDYVDLETKYQGTEITLSYIIPAAFDRLKEEEVITSNTYNLTQQLLLELPNSSIGFFPKTYNVPTKELIYDDQVNLIDQFYVGYHRAQWGGDVSPLLAFAKQAFSDGGGMIYGRYDGVTGRPIVEYEAVAVYALAILMCLEIGEVEFAEKLISRMNTLQVRDFKQPYYGGYIDLHSRDTHTFDNLLAMIAERRWIDEQAY
ncbi:hypothetical protein ACFQ38_14755 [Sporosarcina contaminans]|uniref:Glycosyl hydrolases family 8 n=1 Tax=Sporosarcina contaminans TaxID=633403 RepID=A0ABW3U160_9BACL